MRSETLSRDGKTRRENPEVSDIKRSSPMGVRRKDMKASKLYFFCLLCLLHTAFAQPQDDKNKLLLTFIILNLKIITYLLSNTIQ